MVLAALSWAVFAVLSTLVMRPFVRLSASSPEAIAYGVTYGRIVCIGSLGAFLEGIPTIGASFPSAAFSLIMPTFFQAIGCGGRSLAVTLTRQIFGLLPVFWLLSLIGLNYTWLAFPVAETAAGALGYIMYRRQLKVWK